jgi:hypothetical protein
LHVGLDHGGFLPSFVTITDGKCHDVTAGRALDVPTDSIVVMDRAYTDYSWLNALNDKGIFFFHLAAKTIADIYKARWQIELFFKCIKQNLKIKSFVGTSRNAVLTQIWIAMCTYLLLAWIKFSSRIDRSSMPISSAAA